MEIVVRENREPALIDADNCRDFSVRVSDLIDRQSLADVFGAVGVLAEGGTHLFVEPSWLLAHATELAAQAEWRSRFDSMLVFAQGKGWIDGSGRVRAHVEYAKM